MKKLVVIISMMYLLCVTFSVEALDTYSFGKFSHNFNNEWGMDQTLPYHTEMGIGIQHIENSFTLYLEAEQRTEMEKIPDTHTWNPQYQDYFIRSGIWIQMINVEYEHLCSHAVDRRSSRSGAYDRISVSFDSRRIK